MKKRGQVWIETVIYTLIAFVIIGAVLSFAKPKLEEIQDKTVIEQSIDVLENINDIILSIKNVPGNQRIAEIGIKKGTLKINGVNDSIEFEIKSRHTYSQPGEEIHIGSIIVYTEKRGKYSNVKLTLNYSDYNITYQEKDTLKTLGKSGTSYKMSIMNKGYDTLINGSCSTLAECPAIEKYTLKECNSNGECVYKSEKLKIDFNVV